MGRGFILSIKVDMLFAVINCTSSRSFLEDFISLHTWRSTVVNSQINYPNGNYGANNQASYKMQAAAIARQLYQRFTHRSWLSQAWSMLARPPRRLYSLAEVKNSCTILGHRQVGTQRVKISQIQGSSNTGRCLDFDVDFRPLIEYSEDRWVGIATARQLGKTMPPVSLTQIRDVYFVEDGHHRISVAQARGEVEIEAVVTECQTAGQLPWEVYPQRSIRTTLKSSVSAKI